MELESYRYMKLIGLKFKFQVVVHKNTVQDKICE